jgi:hypothetical protein
MAVLPLALAGCGPDGGTDSASGGAWQSPKATGGTGESPKASGGTGESPKGSGGATESRQLVLNYLDAMTDKNVAKGREQLCAPLRAAFDKTATGPNGDFGSHFTVDHAKVTGVRTASHGHEVSASATIVGKSRKVPVNIVFTVTSADRWCIANEVLSGTPTPAAS